MGGDGVCLVGVGRWGANHLRTLAELGYLELVCETDSARAAELRSQGYKCTESFDEVLAQEEVKRLVIVTPAATHYSLAKKALLAGKDVFVEKPLALELNEAKELVEIADQQVGHILLHDPVVEKCLEHVRDGKIGSVLHIKSSRLNFGVIRTEESALWSFGVHDVSIVIALLGGELPSGVNCSGQKALASVHDFINVNLTFSGGRSASINASWLHPYKHRELIIVGTEGFIIYDAAKPLPEQLQVIKTEVDISVSPVRAKKEQPETVAVLNTELALTREHNHFKKCCESRSVPRTDGHEALRVLQVLDAAERSMQQMKTIDPAGTSTKSNDAAKPYFAHETAFVDEGAVIGAGSKIWHFSHVMGGAILGDKCNLGQNVYIGADAKLSSNVKVQNNVSIYDAVVCEDHVFIGPSVVFTNVRNPRSEIVRKHEYETTKILRGASLGANSTIVCGVTIGSYAFVGAGSVVTKDVPPFTLVYGNPAKQQGWATRDGQILDMDFLCKRTGEQFHLNDEGEPVIAA